MTKADLIAVITKAYFPEDFNLDSPVVSKFINRQNRMKKSDLVELAMSATYVLEERESRS